MYFHKTSYSNDYFLWIGLTKTVIANFNNLLDISINPDKIVLIDQMPFHNHIHMHYKKISI